MDFILPPLIVRPHCRICHMLDMCPLCPKDSKGSSKDANAIRSALRDANAIRSPLRDANTIRHSWDDIWALWAARELAESSN